MHLSDYYLFVCLFIGIIIAEAELQELYCCGLDCLMKYQLKVL